MSLAPPEYYQNPSLKTVDLTQQKKLFAKFFRADNAKKARPDGTGLGLYMAKIVVEMQDGEILFSSQEGKGSTFGFELPISSQQIPNSKKSAKLAAAKV